MKEVTYNDWKKNPVPRMMWVWNNDEGIRTKQKVIYIGSKNECDGFPVVVLYGNGDIGHYFHCAEIEEPKKRRMTNRELSVWLVQGYRDGILREYKLTDNADNAGYVNTIYSYLESTADWTVNQNI